ncbi:arginine/lysine/ornithine decarboxylase [Bacillus fengqiuensis]|nr:arginine/lysine/ornithine decarboxylase [Bacillus fengqiuensis]
MDQSQTPLFTKLKEHHLRQTISFHVPGHKNGRVFPEKFSSPFADILNIDVTELTGLDDLHDPEGVIAESQHLAANLYGVDKTYFLVNGSTVGNLASILSVISPNDTVIVQRDCHKSVLNALKMANARPIFIAPEYDGNANVCIGVDQEDVIKAIKQYPSAKAVILTNPNYYGITRNLKGIIEFAHYHQIPVIVDEAHGAHFILEDPFPASAVQAGADLVIQSAHKTLPAMTMGSYLHVQGTFINMERLEFYLRALQSSSPSYPLMASLDLARFYLAQLKSEKTQIRSLVQSLTQFKKQLNELEGMRVVSPLVSHIKEDPLKVMIEPVHPFIKTGYSLQRQLESQQIYSELADLFHVLLVLPLSGQFPFEQSLQKMKKALEKAINNETVLNINQIRPFHFQNIALAISYEEMQLLKKRTVPFEKAIGKIAASSVIPYPPGIPILMEGELITNRHLAYISHLQELGAKIQGGQALSNQQLEVFSI